MRLMSWMCLSLAVLLASCGGGSGTTYGGGGNTSETPTTVVPVASDLLLTVSSSSLSNSGSDSITVTVTAVNASRVATANVDVALSADNNAVIVASTAKTNTNGVITATVRPGTDRSNRVVTVTATSGTLTRTASFAVIGSKINATVLQAVIAPSAPGEIQYRVVDVNSNPMVNMPITVSAVGVAPATGATDSNGVYAFSYTAPATAGTLDVTATAAGVSIVNSIIVQGSGTSSVPAVNPASITSASVSANPSVVSVNTPTSNNRTEIRALFLGANNAPIPNVRVKFDLDGDANSIGGSLSSASNVVIADANGIASTAYIPGTRSSPTNGVTVRACYYGDDTAAAAGSCTTNAARAQLTVISEPLAVSIGTDNTISDGAGGLAYIKRYVVLVVDAAGQAKSGVQITPSVDLTGYMKGYYVGPGGWHRTAAPNPANLPALGYLTGVCANEDVNRNGVLEGLPLVGEDINGNGQLDPRKSDVAISVIGTGTTDTSGVATIQIQYPKNVATWLSYRILVTASGISGTEGKATWVDVLPALDGDLKADIAPAFMNSPYGRGEPGFIDTSTTPPTVVRLPRTLDQECRTAD